MNFCTQKRAGPATGAAQATGLGGPFWVTPAVAFLWMDLGGRGGRGSSVAQGGTSSTAGCSPGTAATPPALSSTGNITPPLTPYRFCVREENRNYGEFLCRGTGLLSTHLSCILHVLCLYSSPVPLPGFVPVIKNYSFVLLVQ